MSRISILILILFYPRVAPAQYIGPREFDFPPIPYDARISYGADSLQHADLRLPPGDGPFPIAVIIHGGCWQGWHGYRQVEKVAKLLTDMGWASWNLEYRQATTDGGGWTGTFDDIGNGIDAIRDATEEYPLDSSRIVTIGHSAGGHLALWAAARHKIPSASDLYSEDPLPIAGAISLGGIADLTVHFDQADRLCGEGVTLLMGGSPREVPNRYKYSSPASLLPLEVPQLLLHGIDDPSVPVSLVEGYAVKARQVGDQITLVVIPNAGHFETMAPRSDAWKNYAADPLSEFLSEIQSGSRAKR